jgi:hypothetical protein
MIIEGIVNNAISWTIKRYLRSLRSLAPNEVVDFVRSDKSPPMINIPAKLRINDSTPPTPRIINNDTKN